MTMMPPKSIRLLLVHPRPYGLRREITLAILVKLILLAGLWFLIFRWQGKPAVPPPDIATHFQLAPSTAVTPSASHPSTFSENPP
ncbi:MAG: cytochrome oxidase putative small subunit CydP [Methylococcaceae bacterium]|jgi:hypothetical protein